MILNWIKRKSRGESKINKSFTIEEAKQVAESLKIDFTKELFNLREFAKGLNVELEHGTRYPRANITGDNPILTGKIALAHLLEFPNYYTRLSKLEEEATAYWKNKK